MKVVVRAKAEDDIDDIFAWIAKDNTVAAIRIVVRIREHINRLKTDSLARIGHRGFVDGTLEIVEYPYIIVYTVREKRREAVVLSIVHGARNR